MIASEANQDSLVIHVQKFNNYNHRSWNFWSTIKGTSCTHFLSSQNFLTRSDLDLSAPLIAFLRKMSTFLIRILLVLVVIAMTIPQQSGKTITAMLTLVCALMYPFWPYEDLCECMYKQRQSQNNGA